MSNAYRTTSVPVSRSQERIRKLLRDFGAAGVQFGENFQTGEINVRFAKDIAGNPRTVSLTAHIPPVEERKTRTYRRWDRNRGVNVTYTKTPMERRDQMERATYRALENWLKAQFVAVEFGLRSFEDVFLSDFEWMVDGKPTTLGQIMKPKFLGIAAPVPPVESEEGSD